MLCKSFYKEALHTMKEVKENIETNDPVNEESSRRIRKNFTEDPGWPRKPAGPDPILRGDPPRTTRCPPLGSTRQQEGVSEGADRWPRDGPPSGEPDRCPR